MAITYDKIATTTLSSSQSSVTFSSISSAYTDLILIINGPITSGENSYGMRLNSDTSSNYSTTALYGDGSSAQSLRQTNATRMFVGRADTSNSTSIINLMNYSNTNKNKVVLARGASGSYSMIQASYWRQTAAINSITIAQYDFGGIHLAQTSTFTLYGILKA